MKYDSKILLAIAALLVTVTGCAAETGMPDGVTVSADDTALSGGADQVGAPGASSELELVGRAPGRAESTDGRERFGGGQPEPWTPPPWPGVPTPQK